MFEKASEMTLEKMQMIIREKPELKGLPIICGADFGHTTPCFTFPIGGEASLQACEGNVKIILEQGHAS